MMKIKSLSILIFFLVALIGCTPSSDRNSTAASDGEAILRGEKVFMEHCTSCHGIERDGIGPALGGLPSIVKSEWIARFIKNPAAMIQSGDERAVTLHEKYKVIMPAFSSFTENQLSDIVAFLGSQKIADGKDELDPLSLKDPIPGRIPMSDLVIKIKQVAVIPPSSTQGQLTRICKMDYRADSKDLYVVDLRGKLYQLQKGIPKVYLDMAKERPNFIDKPGLATGFGSFAFHPDFASNGLLYTSHSEKAGSAAADFTYHDSIKVTLQWVITEWKTDHPEAFPFVGKSRELMRINMLYSWHGVQEITFNPLSKKGDEDFGLLYAGIGDGSSVEYGHPELAHSKEKIWGTIIRIDPSGSNSRNGKYGIPVSNPFVKEGPNTVKEIFAYGFRNPHRISWIKAGLMLASNIGQHHIESVNLILKGQDYGWPMREGTFAMDLAKGMSNVYPLPENDKNYHFAYPVVQYDHDEGNAISGGYEYKGETIGALKGKYVFGDIVNGRLFFVSTETISPGIQSPIEEWRISLNGEVRSLQSLCGADKVDLRFGRDAAGEIYLLVKQDGKIYKLIE
jgi:mono/diheme cytochrome c family protein